MDCMLVLISDRLRQPYNSAAILELEALYPERLGESHLGEGLVPRLYSSPLPALHT